MRPRLRCHSRWLCRLTLFGVLATQAVSAVLHAQPSPTAILDRLQAKSNRPIDFHAAAFPDTVYVGQQVTYQVAVLLSESARARLRRIGKPPQALSHRHARAHSRGAAACSDTPTSGSPREARRPRC